MRGNKHRQWRWEMAVIVFLLIGGLSLPATGPVADAGAATQPKWTAYDRPAQYQVKVEKDVPIPMRDGTVLRADVYRPDSSGKFPVILTQTPYNKNGALGQGNPYFVERGYVHVVVDVRGTGGSQGTWESFGEAEQRDGAELVGWAARQPWSDGNVGLWGASYMAINQIFTAAQHPPGLKAIFPIVPMGDSYRDIMMSGGQANTGFIPLWLGLVTSGGVLPPTYTLKDPAAAGAAIVGHAGAVSNFQTSTLISILGGGELGYDGPFYRIRSPLEVADQVNVPAFVVGGLHDIFQRGEPLLYEKMKDQTTAKLLIGNWNHGNFGQGLPRDGVPTLDQIALRWFDHYLKGKDTHPEKMPDVTQYVLGKERFKTQADWPHPGLTPQKVYLEQERELSWKTPKKEGSDTTPQHPVNGICSGSTNQWTAGAVQVTPCSKDNRVTELTELTYTTPVLDRDLKLSGPIAARLYASTTAKEAVVSVRITDVAPDGTSTELTAGWLAASLRQTDPSRSRFIKGENIAPWHPFTRASVQPVTPGKVMKLNVEIFPTHAVIPKGHRLRVAIGPSDFPHAVSPLPQSLKQAGGFLKIHHGPDHPSNVVLPVVEKE
ncbi:putative peptidase [Marinithermofilum abyssi]|uniref:Putative peptidase n=1 Tax=Marinithermofilum abyssi TaxID=1571185 RepID=A0A8J2YCA9_9BACL|nr:CocE/NonD family hydrolase [Marinithermofilum abyssi]GGE13802.1 putative peptidase [Marinithermofilum abyssi]